MQWILCSDRLKGLDFLDKLSLISLVNFTNLRGPVDFFVVSLWSNGKNLFILPSQAGSLTANRREKRLLIGQSRYPVLVDAELLLLSLVSR